MGEVWAGKWQRHTDVAVKVISSGLVGQSDAQKLAFTREVSLLK
jgi:ribosomal protein S9